MKLKQFCPHLSASEIKSLTHKTNLLVDFVFGKQPKRNVFCINKHGVKVMTGMRAIRPVKIFNKIYGSMSMASRELNMNVATIGRRCESTEYKDRNFSFIEPPKHKMM